MTEKSPLEQIKDQIVAAKSELDEYQPQSIDWYSRSISTAEKMVPWLCDNAEDLKYYTDAVLNSPRILREHWAEMCDSIADTKAAQQLTRHLEYESVLLKFVAGDTVSSTVTKHLLESHPQNNLAGNSKSDYPDIYLLDADYSQLELRQRGKKQYGASLRGKQTKRPARVPDGIEIKTSRNGKSIDCHFPHVGLHLMLSFIDNTTFFEVDDVLIAFLRKENYRIGKRSTEATTVKASFNRSAFISIL